MEMAHTAVPATTRIERPWWKTLLVATLLMFIPFVGWGMAATYVVYRGSPRNFRWLEAFFVGLLLAGVFLVLTYAFVKFDLSLVQVGFPTWSLS